MIKNKLKMGITVLCIAALTPCMAFADTLPAQNSVSTPNEISLISAQLDNENASQYISKAGTITEVTQQDGLYSVFIDDADMGIILHLAKDAFVFDQASNATIAHSQLKAGMKVVAAIDANSPQTMSIPAQTPGAAGLVVLSEGSYADLSVYNDELVNAENSLQLNIAEQGGTQILLSTDLRASYDGLAQNDIAYNAEFLKGKELLVIYSTSTRSIPAQTTPQTVIVMDSAAADNTVQEQDSYCELRAEAEAKGYEVKWNGKDKPITLTKDDMTVEIALNSDEFTFTHSTKDIKALDMMEKLALPAVLESGKTMVPQSFIDALE